MSKELANQLLEAGVHFGHQTRKWNPKMRRFIFGEKNGIHVIDLLKTITCLDRAREFVKSTAAKGGKILFVATKPQAREIMREGAQSCEMPFVINRWLGGLLTNFDTLRKSVRRYQQLVEMTTDGTFDKISKKEASLIKKEIAKLEKNLIGVVKMEKLPTAIFVVDAKREIIAVREAVRLKIPVVAISDTNANPDLLEYPIPANDDAVRSVKLLVKMVVDSITEGATGGSKGIKPLKAASGAAAEAEPVKVTEGESK